MKVHTFILALGGLVGAASLVQAQTAAAPPDPLSDAQAAFGKIVGDAFHAPDPVVNAPAAPDAPGPALGRALRTSLEVPGAGFAALMQPLAAADPVAAPAPAPAAPRHRHARIHRRHVPAQG